MDGRKAFKDLEFRDAFMFATVMEDAELCRQTLERILGFAIRKVRVHAENTILLNSDYRGVRLDVYADDEEGTIYDVEFQTTDKGDIGRRSRLYQGQMDVQQLNPGDAFGKLPDSYVIFICTFDPFGKGLYRYTYLETCKENGELLNGGTCKIYLNTNGINREEVPPELIQFLAYAEHSSHETAGSDPLLQQLDNRIRNLKQSRGLEVNYMRFLELINDECDKIRAEERAKAEAEKAELEKKNAKLEADRAKDREALKVANEENARLRELLAQKSQN